MMAVIVWWAPWIEQDADHGLYSDAHYANRLSTFNPSHAHARVDLCPGCTAMLAREEYLYRTNISHYLCDTCAAGVDDAINMRRVLDAL